MEELEEYLNGLLSTMSIQEQTFYRQHLNIKEDFYPFNRYELVFAYLIDSQKITLVEYLRIRSEYFRRNKYLYLFKISPRRFGEQWGQEHLTEIAPELINPTIVLDANYDGQYDFLLDNRIKIEVKASRAVEFDNPDPLYVKALTSNSLQRFDMNFQQVKPACCDVFVWVGVWRDVIKYWVLSAREVQNNRYYSAGQHRGNVGEGQLHVKNSNITEFMCYQSTPGDLIVNIRAAYQRQYTQ